MADPAQYRPKPGEIPTSPGVYRFKDPAGRVIYVGKAINLRSRLSSYFRGVDTLHPRTRAMVTTASGVEWTEVANELEALQLEYTWIKEFTPRFNVKFRDDKSYPYLAITMSEEYPRVFVTRGKRRRGNKYFGPYTQVWAIRETVDLLLKVFPMRSCSAGVFRRSHLMGRPCLLGYIGRCSAPCVGKISVEDHRKIADDFSAFMAGKSPHIVAQLQTEMQEASDDLEFERAAQLRDNITALTTVLEKSAVVFTDDTDADVFGVSEDELEAAVQVFHVRGGRVRGQKGWIVEKVEDLDTNELVADLIQQVYGELSDLANGSKREEHTEDLKDAIPRMIIVPTLPSDPTNLEDWLSSMRDAAVRFHVPQRGEKLALLETVQHNAQSALQLHRVRRTTDITSRSEALNGLREALSMAQAPYRIECYDISHVQGTNVVGSMVVFEDGLPKKSDYRKFTITGEAAHDDTSSMRNVLQRRFHRVAEERSRSGNTTDTVGSADDQAPSSFGLLPDLIVVDGGLPQVNAAVQALAEIGVVDVAVCGLAKRLEEVWLPDDDFPIILPRQGEALYMLQRIRDEAHRFAITFHRQSRSKGMTRSELEDVPGLGEQKRKALLSTFKSVRKIKEASVEELQDVPGIGPQLAHNVYRHFHPAESVGAVDIPNTEEESVVQEIDRMGRVDTTTGEILD